MSVLPAFKIYLADGTSYVTSMSVGITLADATAYFKGKILNRGTYDKDYLVRCTNVEQIC